MQILLVKKNYIFSVESEKALLLATEPVVPLLTHLESLRDNESYLAWGIYQIFKGISFLHEVGLVHGCLHAGSIFVTPGNHLVQLSKFK